MNIPIPYSNLGSIIPEMFSGIGSLKCNKEDIKNDDNKDDKDDNSHCKDSKNDNDNSDNYGSYNSNDNSNNDDNHDINTADSNYNKLCNVPVKGGYTNTDNGDSFLANSLLLNSLQVSLNSVCFTNVYIEKRFCYISTTINLYIYKYICMYKNSYIYMFIYINIYVYVFLALIPPTLYI
jgi:hypothetical protein